MGVARTFMFVFSLALQSHHHQVLYTILMPTTRPSDCAARGAPHIRGMFKRNSNEIQMGFLISIAKPDIAITANSRRQKNTDTKQSRSLQLAILVFQNRTAARSTAAAFERRPHVVQARPGNVISDARSASLIGSCCSAPYKCKTLELQSSIFP